MKDFLEDISVVLEYVERQNKQDSEIEVAQAVADIEEFLSNNYLIPVLKSFFKTIVKK
jgi:predicted type IV restriction endonuclease